MSKITKAFAINNARISFVSLVDKAANKRKFLITKAEDGAASFQSYGRIVKADANSHYVTGVVYEPMTEDTDGNYMTEEGIVKAAYWYAKNGNQVDIQHTFEPVDSCCVVESWVAKADFTIDGEKIRKGTWLMTVEVNDDDIWQSIEKGDITGFSMGGIGDYSEEDVDVAHINKSEDSKSLFKRLADTLGSKVVDKGMKERYDQETSAADKRDRFWLAYRCLEEELNIYNDGSVVVETDETKIRTVLQEFSDIVVELLSNPAPIAKALAGNHKEALNGAPAEENTPPKAVEKAAEEDNNNPEKEEKPNMAMTTEDVQKIFEEALGKVLAAKSEDEEKPTEVQEEKKPATEEEKKPTDEVDAEEIKKMVEDAVAKAMKPAAEEQPKPITATEIQSMIDGAVEKAVSAVMKSKTTPSNLNGAINKAGTPDVHYLHGIL